MVAKATVRTHKERAPLLWRSRRVAVTTVSGNSFDIAVMALVIHFVPDPAKAVAQMWRALRRHCRSTRVGLQERWIADCAPRSHDEGDGSPSAHPAKPASDLVTGP